MKVLLLFVLGLAVGISCLAKDQEVKGETLSFQIKDGVKFENKTKNKMEFYSFEWGQPGTMFMLYRNSAITSKDMLKPMTEIMSTAFKDQMKKQPGMEIKSFSNREVSLGIFSGTELEFVITNTQFGIEIKQYMFLLWDGNSCWSGQFSDSSAKDISTVYDILKNAKRITETK